MERILIVVDMQKDFIDGALGTKEAQAIVQPVIDKIAATPKANVYATQDTHPANYLNTQEGTNLPVPHCIKGTPGWALEPRIAAMIPSDHVVEKPSFGSVILAERMRKIAAERDIAIELVGLCTDICVVSNALMLKAFLPEVPIAVDARCCAGVTPESHAAALQTMAACQVKILQ